MICARVTGLAGVFSNHSDYPRYDTDADFAITSEDEMTYQRLGPNRVIDRGDGTLEIELTKGKICLIDKADYDLVKEYRWTTLVDADGPWFYAIAHSREKGRRNIRMQRLIVSPPPDKQVDHINHNTLDNRRCNLRVVDQYQNQRNRRGAQSNNSVGILGVNKARKYWRARMKINGKQIVRHCRTLEDAIAARAELEKQYPIFEEAA